jgi:hypothetical protein
LQDARENANIDAGLEFIWRISAKTNAARARCAERLRNFLTGVGTGREW